MKPSLALPLLVAAGFVLYAGCNVASPRAGDVAGAQVPSWSEADLESFQHGTMSTELVPETVLRAFTRTYPELFPSEDLSNFGLIPDPKFGWPVGFSRRRVAHLGGLSAVGLNCAACHVGEVAPTDGGAPVRVLGMTSHFDAEAYFGSVIGATFLTLDPANLRRFCAEYLGASGAATAADRAELERQWKGQEKAILAAVEKESAAVHKLAPGTLVPIAEGELSLDGARLVKGVDLAALAGSFVKLFHNVRAALHLPDQPPEKAPPASGPGRNDAFGLLSAVLFGEPQPTAPVKYGLVWNLAERPWVHWDGNTRSPLGRNLLASLGLGAPLVGKQGWLELDQVQRQTELSQQIAAPKYPFAIDSAAAARGAKLYGAQCAACHDGAESDKRLYAASEIGTEPRRAELFTQRQADRFNKLLAELETPGYRAAAEPGIRSTQKFFAASMAGVWARSPYLHNGSVRTMQELLTAPAARAKRFRRGTQLYDAAGMGYLDSGTYLLDTTTEGNSNAGHDYGTALSAAQKRDLIEYLKTL